MPRRRLQSIPTPSPDMFTPASPSHEYDEDMYYLSSTNAHDHSMKIQTRFPPDLIMMAQRLIDDDANPYESIQDVIRDAVVHVLHKRRVFTHPDIAELLTSRRLKDKCALVLAIRQTNVDTLTAFEQVMTAALRDQDKAALGEAIDGALEGVPTLSEPWRAKLKELVDKFQSELALMRVRS